MRDGEQGYMVVTPLERGDDPSTKVLVNRGWVSKKFADQRSRPDSVKQGEKVRVEGMLREPWKKNMFTPDNRPDIGEFYFPDVKQMAELTGSQPVWIEQTLGGYLCFVFASWALCQSWTWLSCPYTGIMAILAGYDTNVCCTQSPISSLTTTTRLVVFPSVESPRSTFATTMRSTSLHGMSQTILDSSVVLLDVPCGITTTSVPD